MEQVKVSLPHDLKVNVSQRIEELGIASISEYFRLLANLDISMQRYQQLASYINMLYNKINEMHANLEIYAAPLQEIPIMAMENYS